MDPEKERIETGLAGYRRLRAAAHRVAVDDFEAVLALGAAVLEHGREEERHLYAINRFLDPAVRDELIAEHRELEEHLLLLRRLMEAEPQSGDLAPLAAAVRSRLRRHLERDGRVLYRPLQRPDLRL